MSCTDSVDISSIIEEASKPGSSGLIPNDKIPHVLYAFSQLTDK